MRHETCGIRDRLAAGGWRLAAGGWRLAAGGQVNFKSTNPINFKSI
jgi:hypothetical protein